MIAGSPRVDPTPAAEGVPQVQASPPGKPPPPSASFDDKLDYLRSRFPERSSQYLRTLLQQAGSDLDSVLSMFA